MTAFLSATIQSELANIRIASSMAHSAAEVFATTRGFEGNIAEFCHAFELSVSEAITNAVRYADPSEADAVVTLAFESTPDALTVTVTDSNAPFNALPPAPEIQGYPEGGFGLFIISKLMDEVSCQHKDGRNILTMAKHIDRT